jgi:GLPGLI family protein
MKKYLLAILICASWGFISNEVSQGVITYTTKVNMHKRIPPEQEELKKMIPEFNTTQNQLFFNELESLFKPLPVDENPFEQSSYPAGGQRMIRVVVQNETYINRDNDMMTQLREFMGKKYLVKKETSRIPWKLGIESKEISGYTCKNATYSDENQREITAWYTEQIRLPLGPESFHGLPGLILEVAVNTDEMVITADKIDLRALKKNELKEPKGGEVLTDEAYKGMVQAEMEKMGVQGGQGGMRMIIRN